MLRLTGLVADDDLTLARMEAFILWTSSTASLRPLKKPPAAPHPEYQESFRQKRHWCSRPGSISSSPSGRSFSAVTSPGVAGGHRLGAAGRPSRAKVDQYVIMRS